MDKTGICQELKTQHERFIAALRSLSYEDFQRKTGNKWTAGQQLEHIVKSVRQVDKAFGMPLPVLKTKFGLLQRPSVSYKKVVKDYLKVLEENPDYVLPEHFSPEEIPFESRDEKLEELIKLINSLSSHVLKIKEEELDSHILPHPVMGKLSLREVLYFKIYHVQHHEKQILQNLKVHTNAAKS